MYQEIYNELLKYDTIIIHRHKNPDGDALGSQIGLKELILANFPTKKVYIVGDEAGRYSFMAGSVMDEISDEAYQGALAVILDCGADHLISDERYKLAESVVRFDHHLFCGQIAKFEAIHTEFESCCGLIADFALRVGLKLNTACATALYTGMVTDSGRFRYDNTTAKTFEIASKLMAENIDLTEIYQNLYAEDFEGKKQRASFILKIQFTENNVAYVYNSAEEVLTSGLDIFSVSRGMVGTMADIKGVSVWVNFTEAEQGVLCEIRSSDKNINPIAVKYGGGGHKKASGATVASKEEAMAMLADLDALVKEQI